MANSLLGMMGSAPAANPAMGAVAQNMSNLKQAAQSAKRMMGMLNGVKNPQQALQMVAQQNPQLNSVIQMLNGRNPQEVYMEECQKHGVDPNIIINALKG